MNTHEREPNDRVYRVDVVHQPFDVLIFFYVLITGIAAFAALRTLSKIREQARLMNCQLVEMQKAREQTDKIIKAASDQVTEMQNAGKQTTELIKHAEAQVAALADSAKAALLSAQAVVNAERPWLFIEIKTTGGPGTPVGEVPQHMGFSVSFRNWGKTSAEVVSFDQHPDCRENLDDLPWPPKYALEGQVWAHTRMVPPGQEWYDPGEPYFSPQNFLLNGQWEDIRVSRKRFIYWGRLQYRDLIEESKTIHEIKKVGTIHETCFCYFWSPRLDEFLICGPLGYNKHT